jgi:3-oxoacyl-[acyl-carrier-protein] synthase-1
MRRVVVTGIGIVSSIGNNSQEVLASLREAKSGIVKADDYARLGFRCQVHGAPNCDLDQIDRKARRFMGDGAAWNYISMQQAIADSGLEESDVKNDRTGLIMGSGDISTRILVAAADLSASTLRCTDRVVPDLMCLGNGSPPASARKCAELCGRANNVSDETMCCFGIVTSYSAGTAANVLAAFGTPTR